MSLANDWGRGITVNCLGPGCFHTAPNKVLFENQEWADYLCDHISLRRPGEPQDLYAAVSLLPESRRYITGQTLLDGGGISTGATRALVLPAPATSER